MSSNAPPALTTKTSNSFKAANISNQNTPTHSQANAFFASEGLGQRRSGSNTGAATAKSSPSPRNNQTAKSKHKASRRFRLADEDAFAESVCLASLLEVMTGANAGPQAAMQSTSSRKGQTSITHLMNFSLPPRPQHQPQNRFNNTRHARRNLTWGLGSGYHAVDKAR